MSEQDTQPGTEQLPPFKIEKARSGRSKCKTCKRTIDLGVPRIGVLLEGPFGAGYLWHHIPCLAKRDMEQVEAAYAGGFAAEGLALPPLAELRTLAAQAAEAKAEKQLAPFVERAATGRSKCAHCAEPIGAGEFRFGLLRTVEFYGQSRKATVKVHAGCVAAALEDPSSATEPERFEDEVRANTRLAPAEVEAALGATRQA